MSKIVTIGSVCQDIFLPTNEGVLWNTSDDILSKKKIAFELGAKYAIEKRFESLGGNSINVAVGLKKLGEEVFPNTTVGDDALGKWILKELQLCEINTEIIKIKDNCKSDFSTIIIDKNNSDRIIFSNHEANNFLHFDKKNIGIPNWIFIGDLSKNWKEIIDDVITFSKEKKIRLAFNPRQKTIHEDVLKILDIISNVEIIFINKDEAIEIVSGMKQDTVIEFLENEEYLLKVLFRLGPEIVVITDGENGAWCFNGEKIVRGKALKRDVIDTTGAGDAFTSGFLAAYIKNIDIETSMKWGIANSSSSISEYGGQKGLLNESDIENICKNVIIDIVK